MQNYPLATVARVKNLIKSCAVTELLNTENLSSIGCLLSIEIHGYYAKLALSNGC